MNAMDSQTLNLVVGIAIALLVVLAAWLLYRQKQTQSLQRRFGPEYKRAVDEMGSRSKAESELMARQKRVEHLQLVPLPPAEAARFNEDWKALQTRFVDNPQGAVAEADHLVRELMQKRGYPMGDFEHRAADISVDHPRVVEHYRAAHDIALRDRRGEADTEQLRQAVVHYRALFAELLEVEQPPRPQPPQRRRERELETQS